MEQERLTVYKPNVKPQFRLTFVASNTKSSFVLISLTLILLKKTKMMNQIWATLTKKAA